MSVHGVMTAKFALKAGVLLIAARINAHPVTVMLDPSTPVSIASDNVARRVGIDPAKPEAQAVRHKPVIGLEATSVRLRTLRTGHVDAPAAMIVGNDVLRGTPILLDFARDRLHLPERGDARHREARLQPIEATVTSDGCYSIAARDAAGQPIHLAVVGTPADLGGQGEAATIGGRPVTAFLARDGRCPSSQALIGWDAFREQQVLIDIPASKLWLPTD